MADDRSTEFPKIRAPGNFLPDVPRRKPEHPLWRMTDLVRIPHEHKKRRTQTCRMPQRRSDAPSPRRQSWRLLGWPSIIKGAMSIRLVGGGLAMVAGQSCIAGPSVSSIFVTFVLL
jgi:hypothetical protein